MSLDKKHTFKAPREISAFQAGLRCGFGFQCRVWSEPPASPRKNARNQGGSWITSTLQAVGLILTGSACAGQPVDIGIEVMAWSHSRLSGMKHSLLTDNRCPRHLALIEPPYLNGKVVKLDQFNEITNRDEDMPARSTHTPSLEALNGKIS